MLRIHLFLAAGLLLLGANCLTAQRDIPSPSWVLNDVKHEVTAPPPPAEGKYQEADGRRFVRIDPTPTRIWVLTFSEDGKYLAAGKDYGRIVIWDVKKKSVCSVIGTGNGSITRVAISPDDQFVAASTMGLTQITMWHIPDGKQVNSIAIGKSPVEGILFTHDPGLLIYSYSASSGPDASNGITSFTPTVDVANPLTGARVASFPHESSPVLSTDGATLMTQNSDSMILRSTIDWKEQNRLPRLTNFAVPVFLDLARGWYLFSDSTDDHRVVVAQLSDGSMPQKVRLANLPEFSHWIPSFAAIEPRTGVVFGHGSGYLWALDLRDGKTCFSPNQFSEGAALSHDGSLVAGAFDSPAPTDSQDSAGVAIWKTRSIAKSCHLK